MNKFLEVSKRHGKQKNLPLLTLKKIRKHSKYEKNLR